MALGPQRHQRRPSGTEVEQKRGGGALGRLVSLPIHVANMLKSLKARSKQAYSYLALMGHPNAFPSVPKASASDWTIM